MQSHIATYRNLVLRAESMFAALRTMLGSRPGPAQNHSAVRKLDYDGQPIRGNARIAPVVVHNGFIYVSGQGANDNGPAGNLDIATHVRNAMDNVKKLVEAAGGDMDNILQVTVYLSTLEFYEEMNKAYRPYFPNRGPARATVSVAGIPGASLIEVSCIARVLG